MGDENVFGAQQASRTQRVVVSQVEEEGALRPADFHIDPRVSEPIVYEIAAKGRGHDWFITSGQNALHYT